MEIKEYKCPNCGSSLEIYIPFNRAFCEYCNSNFIINNKLPTESTLPNTISFKTDVRNHISIITYDDETIKSALSIISGVSCIQGNNFDVSIGYTDGEYDVKNRAEKHSFSNDYSITTDLKTMKNKIYRHKWADFKASVRHCSDSLNESGNRYINKICELFNYYGCSTTDRIEKTGKVVSFSNYAKLDTKNYCDRYIVSVNYSGTFHHLIGEVCITPSYFCKYFSDIYDIYKSIQAKKELLLLAKHLSDHLIDYYSRNPDSECVVLDVSSSSVCLKERFGDSANSIDRMNFHDIGMENLTESKEKVMIAITIVLITQMNKNGLNIGFSDIVELDPWDGRTPCFSNYNIRLKLVNMQKPIYKSFLE